MTLPVVFSLQAWHLQARALSENGSALDAMDSYATAFRLLRERKEARAGAGAIPYNHRPT